MHSPVLLDDLHREHQVVVRTVLKHSETCVDSLGLQVDPIGRLGVRFYGQYAGMANWGKDDQFPEFSAETQLKLGMTRQVDKPGSSPLARELEVRQDVVERKALYGLTGPEIER